MYRHPPGPAYIHTHTYIHACMNACIHPCMHECVHTWLFVHTCSHSMDARMHAYMHTCMHTCFHEYTRTHVHIHHTDYTTTALQACLRHACYIKHTSKHPSSQPVIHTHDRCLHVWSCVQAIQYRLASVTTCTHARFQEMALSADPRTQTKRRDEVHGRLGKGMSSLNPIT